MTRYDVAEYVSPLQVKLGATAYAKLNREDLLGRVFTAMRAKNWAFNLDAPRIGNVCIHFTRRACCHIQDTWADSPHFDPSIPDAACFEFWFLPDVSRGFGVNPVTHTRDYHSLALCFTDHGADFIDFMNLTAALPTLWTLSHDEFLSREFAH